MPAVIVPFPFPSVGKINISLLSPTAGQGWGVGGGGGVGGWVGGGGEVDISEDRRIFIGKK